jgi:hypothetical protein
VRDLPYYAIVALQFESAGGVGDTKHSFEPLNEIVAVEVVYDHPQAVSSIGTELLDDWGIDFDEALRTARANLRERTHEAFKQIAPGVHASVVEDGYDAARLLLTELISRLEVDGDPVALVAHRDHLLVTGSDDEAGLRRIAELAEPTLGDNNRISGLPLVLRDGGWQRLTLPAQHPASSHMRRLELLTEAADYADQKIPLQRRSGDDLFVASLMLGENEGILVSYCTWTKGVPSLLPRAEHVVFVSPGKTDNDTDLLHVPWDHAASVMADVLHPQGLLPERWRIDTFPDEQQLRELATRAE